MATYTVSSGRLICTGTDITTQGIVNAVNANSSSLNSVNGVAATASYEDTAGAGSRRSPAKSIIIAEINIGDGGTTASTWQTNREDITIRGQYFRIDGGHFKLGTKLANGTLTNPSNFYYDSATTTNSTTGWQRWLVENNGQITAYGGSIATHRVLTATYTTGDVYLEGVYCSIEFGIGEGGSYQSNNFTNSPIYTYKNCVFDQHVGGVGNKLYQFITYVLENNKVTNNNFGIQPGSQALILSDYFLDTNTYHTVPNLADCDVTLINSDIATLRIIGHTSADIHRLVQRFDYQAVDSSGSALSGVLVRIIDQTSSVVVNNESTDASGRISTLPTYSGIKCLEYKTYAGAAETVKANHSFFSYKYGYGLTSKTIAVQANVDIKETDFKLIDENISESNKATVDAYTEINTAQKLYDRAASFLEDNFGTYLEFLLTRSGDVAELTDDNLVIDATAASAFAYNGTDTFTIHSDTFTAGVNTTGAVTLQNGTVLNGGTFTCDVTTADDTGTTHTNVTVDKYIHTGAGSYSITLDGGSITEVEVTGGGTLTINLLNGATVTTQTETSGTINLFQNVSVTAPNIIDGSRVQLYNVTKAAELDNSVVSGGGGYSYTANLLSSDVDSGDTLRIRATQTSGATAKAELENTGTITISGLVFLNTQTDQAVYASYGVNGATVTGITWDSGNMQFDFSDADNQIDGGDIAAWYFYFITTSTGIDEAFGAIDWPQINRITNKTALRAITFDNTKSSPLLINNCWIDRDDGATIIASTSNSIQINPPAVFINDTGVSGLTPSESTKLNEISSVMTQTDQLTFTGTNVNAQLEGEAVANTPTLFIEEWGGSVVTDRGKPFDIPKHRIAKTQLAIGASSVRTNFNFDDSCYYIIITSNVDAQFELGDDTVVASSSSYFIKANTPRKVGIENVDTRIAVIESQIT